MFANSRRIRVLEQLIYELEQGIETRQKRDYEKNERARLSQAEWDTPTPTATATSTTSTT
jgi:hypothetical protein